MWTLTLGHFMSDWNILINLDQVHTNHTPDLWLPCKKHDGKRACRLNRMPSLPLSPIARTDRYLKSESFTYSRFLHTHTHTHTYTCVCVHSKNKTNKYHFKKIISGRVQTWLKSFSWYYNPRSRVQICMQKYHLCMQKDCWHIRV